jgi:hypothetical protein
LPEMTRVFPDRLCRMPLPVALTFISLPPEWFFRLIQAVKI